MQSTSPATPTRLAAITILSLLLLLALAVGAPAAVAAHSSNGSAAATPAAGTQGRGGVSLAVAPTTPTAGTAGRGGVAALPSASAAASGRSAGAVAFAFSRPRGGIPVPQAGNVPRAVVAPGPMSSADWITAAVIAVFAAAVGVLIYAASRRRAGRNQAALASYCTSHPGDSLCGAT